MTPLVRAILYSPMSRAASYTPPRGGDSVPCRIVLNDTPGETRREAGEEFLFDGAEGVIWIRSQSNMRAFSRSRAPSLLSARSIHRARLV